MNRVYRNMLMLTLAVAGLQQTARAQVMLQVCPAAGGEPQSIMLSDIRKLSFGDDGMTVTGTDGAAKGTFALSGVRSIRFTGLVSGICSPKVTAGADGLTLYCRDGQLHADGLTPGSTARAAVLDIGGRTVMACPQWDGTPIPTATLPAGIYLFKVNNRTIKFTK